MSFPRPQFLPPKPRPMVLPQCSRQRREKECAGQTTAGKWASALIIALFVATLFALFSVLVIKGILPGEFVNGK
jgi:hypothetical protein